MLHSFDRPRLIRGLRIALSAVGGILCVLLIVLWVRSYWQSDCVARFDASQIRTSLESRSERICLAQFDYSKISQGRMETYDWGWEGNQPITEADANPTGPSFEWSQDKFGLVVSIPHWSPVLIFAILATLPWIPWSNRFSLRTVLIGR
jgi:hypothetical protein